jgi:sulfur-carrier protein
MARVWIPALLRELTGGQQVVTASGERVRQLIEDLERKYPGLAARLVSDDSLRPGLSIVVDGMVANRGLLQPVGPDSEVHFLPAIAGGSALDRA